MTESKRFRIWAGRVKEGEYYIIQTAKYDPSINFPVLYHTSLEELTKIFVSNIEKSKIQHFTIFGPESDLIHQDSLVLGLIRKLDKEETSKLYDFLQRHYSK